MKISQKLKLIKRITKKTQEELAKELGVSFVTFNSWINEQSTPRVAKQEKIDDLYRKVTGQKTIPENELNAKKNIIKKKSKKYKSVTEYILKHPDIYDEFLLQITYNSNRIEGSTLTLAETSSILFQNKTMPNKDVIEHLEAKNHQTAFNFLMDRIKKGFIINEEFILKLHRILMNGIRRDAGTYRRHGLRIVGVSVPTANYIQVARLMKDLFGYIKRDSSDIVRHVSIVHSKFEKIHPFSDGNGRIGRLIMQAMLLKENMAPAIIKEQERQLYYTYLQKAQMQEDSSLLEDFIAEGILLGFDIINTA